MKVKLILVACAFMVASGLQAQVLNKLKNKSEQKAGEAIDNLFSGKKKNTGNGTGNNNGSNNGSSSGNSSSSSGNSSSGGSGTRSNNTGGGLGSTAPDVNQNLADADAAYKKASYGEARYAVQQAMLGVELEIGNKILKSLPESISGMAKDQSADEVTSTGFGWAGLTIKRMYNGDKDRQYTVTVANNAMWMAGVNAYLTNGGYAQQTNGQQNWKQTKVKGHRAIIEYDQDSGYKLSVPLGTSSLIVYEGVNIATEADMMKAAEAVDIDGIKKQLGEQ
ncbi:MAG TPA: hypothetical protein VF473_09650 [Cyclobacteriaceae bacterium]